MNNHYQNKPLLAFFFFLCSCSLFAQDTIVVQTLTLDGDARAGVFEFPDDASQTYEKILMRYQMRCHDAAVGNGAEGCREWDYSCNTFITDSTRVDSNRLMHPHYVISSFNGTEFSYTQQPTYSYTQYEQYQIDYSNIISETIAEVGADNLPMTLAGTQVVARAQLLFTAAELINAGLTAGPVTSLRMDVTELGADINFMRIKMKHSAKTELDADDPDFNDFTEVYFLNTAFANTGAQSFNFYNNFDWDGVSNVLVEFSFTNNAVGMPTTVNSHDTGFTSSIVAGTKDNALFFAGIGGVPIDAGPLASISNEITVSLWSYGAPDIMPANSTIFEGVDIDNNRQVNVHLPWSNGQVYWDCGNDGTGYDRINAPADPSEFEGQWNHWAFTKNAATGDMKIYLNGAVFLTGTGKTKPIDINAFKFAQSVDGNLRYFGAIDELRVWDAELDQATIQSWMRQSITASHPNYANLLAYFQLDEGNGSILADESSNNNIATVSGVPNWQSLRGKDLYKDFVASSLRPNITFVQGTYDLTQTLLYQVDSVVNAQHQVVEYAVNGTDLVTTDTFLAYASGPQYIINELGEIVDSVIVMAENTLTIDQLTYYNKFPSKYEILSLVTPYGNGLDLGQNGKTFTFDITDYAPILKGQRRLSVEMGGQNQEELDIRFIYITGTPPREVQNIQNIWPFRRGNFLNILNDDVFEPRQVATSSQGKAFKIRSSITGHGQNGEFVERTHYLNLNGGTDEFTYNVWKECGDIPIYPQGGTWLFDRAGWCPGDPTTVNQFDITQYVTPGSMVEIDYGLLGNNMAQANYLVSNQLVTYGNPNFDLDAALVDVIRPSQKVEHERFNPVCNTPTVLIQNTGSTALTSLMISYQIEGGTPLTYEWTGHLSFLETEEVVLPVADVSFWGTGTGAQTFIATVSSPNGSSDSYANNNTLRSSFVQAQTLDGTVVLNYKTNKRASENKMYLRDHAGDIVLERTVMVNETEYTDELDIPAGCYSLEFTDAGDDGLYYWYWDVVGIDVGTGYLRLRKKLTETLFTTTKNFEAEFGSFVRYDFIIPEIVGAEEPTDRPTLMSVYPNPASTEIKVDLVGYENHDVEVQLYTTTGQLIQQRTLKNNSFHQTQVNFDVRHLPAGLYQIRVFDGEKMRYGQVVVE